jgi:hypothetical protein
MDGIHLFAENAGLAKYCGKTNLYLSILEDARLHLPEEAQEKLDDILGNVSVGNLPHNEWDDYDDQWQRR